MGVFCGPCHCSGILNFWVGPEFVLAANNLFINAVNQLLLSPLTYMQISK